MPICFTNFMLQDILTKTESFLYHVSYSTYHGTVSDNAANKLNPKSNKTDF